MTEICRPNGLTNRRIILCVCVHALRLSADLCSAIRPTALLLDATPLDLEALEAHHKELVA